MAAADEIEDPVIRSNEEDWKGYLASVHSKSELNMEVSDNYSDELSEIQEVQDLDNILGEELESGEKYKEQLAYDFGYSMAEAHHQNNGNMLKLFPDSTFFLWFEDFTVNGHEPPNPQYVIRGLTDFMEQKEEYENSF